MWFGNLTTFHYLCCCLEIDGLKLFWVAGGLKLILNINRQGRGSPWRRNSIQSGTESTPLCSARVELPCLGITFSKVCVFSLSLLVRLCLGVQSKVSHKSAYPWTEASNILMSVGHILFFLMLLNLKQQDKKSVGFCYICKLMFSDITSSCFLSQNTASIPFPVRFLSGLECEGILFSSFREQSFNSNCRKMRTCFSLVLTSVGSTVTGST